MSSFSLTLSAPDSPVIERGHPRISCLESPPPLDHFYADSNSQTNSLSSEHEDAGFLFDPELHCEKNEHFTDELGNPLPVHLNSPLIERNVPQSATSRQAIADMKGGKNLVRVISALYSDSFGSDSSSSEDDHGSNFEGYTPLISDVELIEVKYNTKRSPIILSSPSNASSPCREAVTVHPDLSISFDCISPYSTGQFSSGEEVPNEPISYCTSRNSSYLNSNTDLQTAVANTNTRSMLNSPNRGADVYSGCLMEDLDSISNDDFPIRTPSPPFSSEIVPQEFKEISFKSSSDSNPTPSPKQQNLSYLNSLFHFLNKKNPYSGLEHASTILNGDKTASLNTKSQNKFANTKYPTYEDITPVVTPQRHKKAPGSYEVSPARSVLDIL